MGDSKINKQTALNAIQLAINAIRQNLIFVISILVVFAFIGYAQGILSSLIHTMFGQTASQVNYFDSAHFFQYLFADIFDIFLAIIYVLIDAVLFIELIGIGMRFVNGEKIDFTNYQPQFMSKTYVNLFWRFLGTFLLTWVIVFIGFSFIVIPGIFLALIFLFSTIVVIDTHCGVIDAMKRSAQITAGNKWRLFLFNCVLVISLLLVSIMISGIIAGIGSLVGNNTITFFSSQNAIISLIWPAFMLPNLFVYKYLLKEESRQTEENTSFHDPQALIAQ